MNHFFRLIWSNTQEALVPVPEGLTARPRGRRQMRRARRIIRKALSPGAAAMLIALLGLVPTAQAQPTGGTVVAGQAQINHGVGATTIVQQSARTVLDWQSFSIAAGQTVTFQQPSTSAVALNRVTGSDPSSIYGNLNANGQVFLVNPNGVYFAPGARIDVGGIVASTLDVGNEEFMSGGPVRFSGESDASVVNEGQVTAAEGGYVAFVGRNVTNNGTIIAPGGTVAMGAGGAVELTFANNSLLSFQVSADAFDAEVNNGGTIRADDGRVIMSARSRDALLKTVVNNTGVIEARGVRRTKGGAIQLLGGGSGRVAVSGRVNVSSAKGKGGTVTVKGAHVEASNIAQILARGALGGGEIAFGGGWKGVGGDGTVTAKLGHGSLLDASATERGDGGTVTVWSNIYRPDGETLSYGTILAKGGPEGGNGGRIETSGHKLDVAGIRVDTSPVQGESGLWLLDPYNVIISNGADANQSGQTATGDDSVINVGTIEAALATTNVTVSTGAGGTQAGDITIVDPLTWSSANTLTLDAWRSVIIDATVDVTGDGGVFLHYNNGGTDGNITINAPLNLTQTSSYTTQNGSNAAIPYQIITTLGAPGSTTTTDLQGINGNTLMYYVLGADIDASATATWNPDGNGGYLGFLPIGAFDRTFEGAGHTISGLMINRPDIEYVGFFDSVWRPHGQDPDGRGVVRNLRLTDVDITGGGIAKPTLNVGYTGGLVANFNSGEIYNVDVSGTVTGKRWDYNRGRVSALLIGQNDLMGVGGVVGWAGGGDINDVHSSVDVTGVYNVGGLVGLSLVPGIKNSSSSGNVSGVMLTAAEIADVQNSLGIFTGPVQGGSNIGGIVGRIDHGDPTVPALDNAYFSGNVSGLDNIGGLVGYTTRNTLIKDSYTTAAATVTGFTMSSPTFSQVNSFANSKNVGGLVGWNYNSFITGSHSAATVSGAHFVGGLVGYNVGVFASTNVSANALDGSVITDSYATGDVTGYGRVGGLVGAVSHTASVDADVDIVNSYATGNVTGLGYVGGVVGLNPKWAGMTNTYATGDVSGRTVDGTFYGFTVGGLVGYNLGPVAGSYATGNVTGAENGTGGLVGSNGALGEITDSYATGNVSGNGLVGGLSGRNWGQISGSFASGSSVTGNSNVGGLVGQNYSDPSYQGTITNSYADVTVTGIQNIGGLVGANTGGQMSEVYAAGAVTGTTNVGGLVGYNVSNTFVGTITDAYAMGSVTGTTGQITTAIGGLLGANAIGAVVSNVYSTGAASGSTNDGALIGINHGSLTNGYWNTTTAGLNGFGTDGGATVNASGLTTGMLAGGLPTGFDPAKWSTSDGQTTPWLLSNASFETVSGAVIQANDLSATPVSNRIISTAAQLQNITITGLDGDYVLGGAIDLSGNANFTPIGNNLTAFTGSFNGVGNTISGLTINRPSTQAVGLFGNTQNATIRNVGLTDVSITGDSLVGGLVGTSTGGNISASYVTGSVSGNAFVGGLAGSANGVQFSDSFATAQVTANINAGGLVGAAVTSTFSRSYASGAVASAQQGGGLVGNLSTGSAITDSYATGPVAGGSALAGLVGRSSDSAITNAYASGAVIGSGSQGGLVGVSANGASVTNGYWDISSSGQATSAGGTGLTSAQMQQQASFSGFDFATTPNWVIYEGRTAPLLASFLTPLTVTPAFGSLAYDGQTLSGSSITTSVTGTATAGAQFGQSGFLGGEATPFGTNASDVGTYALDLWSDQQGYHIQPVSSTIQITPRVLDGTLTNGQSVYGDSLQASNVTYSNLVSGDNVTVDIALNLAGPFSGSGYLQAGTYSNAVTATGLSGTDAGNYTLGTFTGGSYTVTRRTLTTTVAAGSSIYALPLTPGAASFDALIAGDVVTAGVSVNTAGNLSGSGNPNVGSYAHSVTLGGADAANYTLSVVDGGYTITPRSLTADIAAGTSIYGNALTPGIATLDYVRTGDTVGTLVSITATGNESGAGFLNAGSYAQTATLTGADAGNYDLRGASDGGYTVTARALNGSIAAGSSVYGDTLAPGVVSFSSLLSGDTVSAAIDVDTAGNLSGAGHLNAGSYASIQSVSGLNGVDAANYSIGSFTDGGYTVTARALSGAIAAGNSIYGDALAPGMASFDDLLSGDIVSAAVSVDTTGNLSGAGHLRAGNYASIQSISGLNGADAGNYTIGSFTDGGYSVTTRSLAATITAGTSVYGDALTPGTVSLASILPGDLVGSFVSMNVTGNESGAGYLNVGSYDQTASLTGTDAANYAIGSVADGGFTVTARALNGSIAAGSSIYGDTLAPGVVSFSSLLSGDTVSAKINVDTTGALSGAGHLNAGSYASIQSISGLSGTDAANYSIGSFTDGGYTVTARALSGAIAAGSSIYGDALAPGTASFDDLLSGDIVSAVVSVDTTGNLSGAGYLRAGIYASVQSISGLSGVDAGNYTIGGFTDGGYTVSQRVLSGSIAAGSSVYGDALTPAALTLSGVLAGDSTSGTSAVSFSAGQVSGAGHLNAGSYAQIASLTGADAANYAIGSVTDGGYTVTTRALNGAIAAGSSVYGDTLAPGVVSFSSLLSGDTVSATTDVDTAGNLSNAGHLNAGSYASIQSISGLSGTDAANYSIGSFTDGGYTVTARALSGAIAAGSSIYGDALVLGTASFDDLLSGDIVSAAVSVDTTGNLSGAGHLNAGTYASVQSISGLNGADAGNYTIGGFTDGGYTVSQRALSGSIAAGSSVYGDALTPGALTLSGVLAGDSTSGTSAVSYSAGQVSGAGHLSVGSYAQTASLAGADAANYAIGSVADGGYTVTARALNGAIAAGSSVYGDTLTPGVVSFSSLLSGDTVNAAIDVDTAGNLSGAGKLNAGSYASIKSVSGLTGVDAANYSIGSFTDGGYTVTARALSATISGHPTKLYDQTTQAALTPNDFTLNGLAVGEAFIVTQTSGTYASELVGTGITVSAVLTASDFIGVNGTDAANYTLPTSAQGTGTILSLGLNSQAGATTGGIINWSPTIFSTGAFFWDVIAQLPNLNIENDGVNRDGVGQ
ncbi:GLUG motif-containing protein [Pseudooceanicola sp. MF1-13]|uniref:two-partner secretion domain-containing protein n=1 Tax=Pseudooceanicola sp. MF1-13 TaxID=3379095 RepID=UPI0038925E18